jgi:urease accessory protein
MGTDHDDHDHHHHDHDDHAHPHPHPHGSHLHPPQPGAGERPLRIGIGGPVGSGKTTLVGALCELLRDDLSLAVVTNDIFTTEDAQALRRAGVLPEDRIVAVETGCCPHTAIRDDIAANLDAIEELEGRLDLAGTAVDVTLVESGGDNLTAVFSTGLVDAQIFVLDTAGGDDVPRKGGPGVAMADVLVINKVDLAPYVGADVDRMLADAAERRPGRPVVPTSLVEPAGAEAIARWIRDQLVAWRSGASTAVSV